MEAMLLLTPSAAFFGLKLNSRVLSSASVLKIMVYHIMITANRPRLVKGARLFPGVLLVVAAAVSSAQDAASVFLKGPYLQGPGTDTMTIKWEAPLNKPAILHYGNNGNADQESRVEGPHPLKAVMSTSVTNVVYLYEARLTNLRPGSVYTYWAEIDRVRSARKKFKTFEVQQPKVTFIAYGDARTNPKMHLAVASNFKRYSPDFILHTGDLVGDGRRYDAWGRDFFGPLADVIDEIPMLHSIGNHEQDGNNYLFYLGLPGKDRWYSYDIGPVHVVALDFRLPTGNDEQFAFARQDLMSSKAPWKVVFMHFPVFNIGGHFTHWGHAAYLPLFHQAKVDLVLTGHSHIYERFRPIAASSGTDSWPIMHITTGGGGAGLYSVLPHPALASFYSTNHFVVLEATASTLKGRTFNINNILLDSFEVRKENGQLSAEYLAQVYPEEALKLTYDAAPSLTASLASAPRTNSAAQAMFTIRPMKGMGQSVQLEIDLTPASRKYYQLEGGPLRVTAPASAEPEKVVWARVRAAGDGIGIDGRGTELLSPALIFQGRIKLGAVETLTYGQRSRVTDAAAEAAKKLEAPK